MSSQPSPGRVPLRLLIWIVVEIWMVGYHPQPPLQLLYGTLGIVLLVLTLLPSVRRAVPAD